MPRSKEHKEETHRRIVATAAEQFRSRGLDGVGIAELMSEAGLTHGGFYAHFASKEALVAEVMQLAAEQSARAASQAVAAAPAGETLITIADRYLTSRHREHPGRGCAVAALGSELARAGGEGRRQLSEMIGSSLTRIAAQSTAPDEASRRREAAGVYAAMVGGLILARATADADEADAILRDVRAFLRDALK